MDNTTWHTLSPTRRPVGQNICMFVYVDGLASPVALQNDMASRAAAASHCAGLHTCDRLPLFRACAVTLQ